VEPLCHHTLPHATADGLDAPTRSTSFSDHYLGTQADHVIWYPGLRFPADLVRATVDYPLWAFVPLLFLTVMIYALRSGYDDDREL
jgi:hypothetical protein